MFSALERLVEISGPPIGPGVPVPPDGVPVELWPLHARKDGFYAVGGALLVRPAFDAGAVAGVRAWNEPALWRGAYPWIGDDFTFFAEDVFGGQFAVGPLGVVIFDPEYGEIVPYAAGLEAWAERVLTEPHEATGYPLLCAWQDRHGLLAEGYRLLPKVAFVLDGEYEVDNLHPVPEIEGMRRRGQLAAQLAGAP